MSRYTCLLLTLLPEILGQGTLKLDSGPSPEGRVLRLQPEISLQEVKVKTTLSSHQACLPREIFLALFILSFLYVYSM